MRRQSGWDSALANTGDNEVWRADGRVSAWVGETGSDAGWRSVIASGSGSSGSNALSVSGLLDGEVIPKGTWLRADMHRYRVAVTAIASGGTASLALSRPLEADVSGDVRLPGDFFVGLVIEQPRLEPAQIGEGRAFSITLQEVYATEVDGGFEYQ
ncbi:MAG: hypothetical protein AAF183_16600 [Pseudomonadota bacterium]